MAAIRPHGFACVEVFKCLVKNCISIFKPVKGTM